MHILFDKNVPYQLLRHLVGHNVRRSPTSASAEKAINLNELQRKVTHFRSGRSVPADRSYRSPSSHISKQVVHHGNAEFLKKEDERAITERLNEVYSRVHAKLDAGLHRAQLELLPNDPWHS